MTTPPERLVAARTLRQAARAMFEDPVLDLSPRDAAWLHSDCFDAGLVAGAKYLLQRADRLECGESVVGE